MKAGLIPDETKGSHANWLKIRVSILTVNTQAIAGLDTCQAAYLEVISNVVPKIWARTNSAMAGGVPALLESERMKEGGGQNDGVVRCCDEAVEDLQLGPLMAVSTVARVGEAMEATFSAEQQAVSAFESSTVAHSGSER